MGVTDIDSTSGVGTLTFSRLHQWNPDSVRINLLTGKLMLSEPKVAPPNIENQVPSPSGKFVLQYSLNPSCIMVKSGKGHKLGEIKGFSLPLCAVWNANEDYFAMFAGDNLSMSSDSGLYVYSMKQKANRLVVRGKITMPAWSDNGKVLACIKPQAHPPKYKTGKWMNPGSLVVLDPGSRKPLITAGKLVGRFQLSPSGNKVCFLELVKDEYGDFDNYSLQVADIRTGKIHKLLTNRREPEFIWAGDDALAVTIYDKYAVPTLSLVSYTGGKTTKLVSTPNFAALKPLAYLAKQERVVYKVCTTTNTSDEPEELWAVKPGAKPMRLFPKVGRDQR